MAHSRLGTVREMLGLTQLDLAIYLRVSRDMLAQAETNRRWLPPAARPRFDPLAELVYSPSHRDAELPLAVTETEPGPPEADILLAVRERLRLCRHELANARYPLPDLQRKAYPLRRRLVILPTLLAALPPAPPDGHPDPDNLDRLWYSHHIADAHQKLTRYGALPQGLLTARIAGLEVEIAALEKLLPPEPA